MAWAKFDDRFLTNPKIMQAGLEARALYIAGVLYCAGELTDGFIAEGVLCKLAALADVPRAIDAADRLIDLALWEQAEGGYIVHDYLEYNPTAEEVKARRDEVTKARSEAGKRGMASRWGDRDNKITNDITKPKQSGLLPVDNKPITPYPSRTPSPLSSSTSVEELSARKPTKQETSIPDDFTVTQAMYDKMHTELPELDIEAATERWVTAMRANTRKYRYTDWRLAWYNGMRNATQWATERGGSNGNETSKSERAILRAGQEIAALRRQEAESERNGPAVDDYQGSTLFRLSGPS
jgi:hypothetical protein